MSSLLLSINIIEWARAEEMPKKAIDLFIEATILTDLKTKLTRLTFDEIDTMEMKDTVVSES